MTDSSDRATLVLVGTPLGNLGDASPRMREEIAAADLIAAEDTRRFLDLAERLEVQHTAKIMSLFDHNEQSRAERIADAVESGMRVVLLTDAGMPGVSDPGYHVVKAVSDRGLPVTSAPGPTAVTTALALSGLPTDRFTFEGFLPRKSGKRRALLQSLEREERTMVFYEAPHRIVQSVEAIVEVFGHDRRIALCRELTKLHEEVIRGRAADVLLDIADGVRGEIALVVSGTDGPGVEPEDVLERVSELVTQGMRGKDAAAQVAKTAGLKTREVYEAYLHRE
ncbi:16S rRNA (cytidine(1402)-2'-O)-methyltransferase [Brevibacterium ravenspurgense]|uniref:Ribosomal RNA small subunit methyltransferase I n=1 Tax=Brevibacterium ravenspurgense TaxID=479117 RepID=A0A2I1IFH3_9MICO|nr:16S rRNA (cytidine(1402)-2'-O)-methyltransferase [Brevibacterium ravenspurgense]PKY69862.1 16S rRNA (cytidine(1402)-2'-O)-methyltransferase [Brevibacterium ravenspurgense]